MIFALSMAGRIAFSFDGKIKSGRRLFCGQHWLNASFDDVIEGVGILGQPESEEPMGVRELRKEVLQKVMAQYSLLVFTQQLDKTKRADLEGTLNDLETATAHQLRDFRDALNKNLRHLSTLFGCKRSVPQLASEYKRLFDSRKAMAFVHKWDIDEIYFKKYEKVWPDWQKRPPHMLVGLDFAGETVGQFFLPEATLYEDMCFSYNNAVALIPESEKRPGDKSKVKAFNFFRRSAVLSSFYFVEAYLNGVAFDFVLRHGQEIPSQEVDYLKEWDAGRNRERWVKFRDKLLQYPKIILKLQHPPLTETNCPELHLIVSEAREVRDSLVHWSPRTNENTGVPTKTGWVLDIQWEKLTQVVDAAVALVRRLNALLGEHGQDWAGCMPETVRVYSQMRRSIES